jgi:murein DD-endopeptidase MepM/ murein hydrolase activator NlpD
MRTATTRTGRTTTSGNGLRAKGNRAVAVLAVLGAFFAASIAWTPAYAADYPSWDEVNAARNDEAAAQRLVNQIEAALVGLKAEAARTAADAQVKGEAYQEADQAYQEQVLEAQNLQDQADAANALAAQSAQQAGQLAAQLVRGGDTTVNLLVNTGSTEDLLGSLEMSSRVGVQSYLILEQALQDKNSAQALTDQANEARVILEELKVKAQEAFDIAQVAAAAAAVAYEAEQVRQAEMQAQLVVLKERRAATEADYLAGVRERWGADASGLGEISDTGWTRPVVGRITDPFGWRVHPIYGTWRLHTGTDIGAGCNAPIYAASGGTVVYAGWYGTYGNFVLIDHGGGVQTGYAHIVNGGILVGVGQSVGVGTNIALVGTTGASTGCHLHFEARIDGTAVDGQDFLAGQGITLG